MQVVIRKLKESLVLCDLVESLCKVKDCNVDLRSPVLDGRYVVGSDKELRILTGTAMSESTTQTV